MEKEYTSAKGLAIVEDDDIKLFLQAVEKVNSYNGSQMIVNARNRDLDCTIYEITGKDAFALGREFQKLKSK